MGTADRVQIVPELPFIKAQFIQRDVPSVTRGQAQYYLLPVNRRHYRCPDVKLDVAPRIHYPPILRKSFLGNVEVRHDFNSVNDAGIAFSSDDMTLNQFSINPETHTTPMLRRLKVNVTRTHTEGFLHKFPDKVLPIQGLTPFVSYFLHCL